MKEAPLVLLVLRAVQNCLLFQAYPLLYIAVCPSYFYSSPTTGIPLISWNKHRTRGFPFVNVNSQIILFQIREEHKYEEEQTNILKAKLEAIL